MFSIFDNCVENKCSTCRKIFFFMFFSIFLKGCANGGAHDFDGNKLAKNEVFEQFKNGSLRLECGTSCSGRWGWSLTTAENLYRNELWLDLFNKVSEIGFRSDLTYFFLARSAEGLSYPKAAKSYYSLALSSGHKCKSFVDNCEGIDVPTEANKGLKRIEKLDVLTESVSDVELSGQHEVGSGLSAINLSGKASPDIDAREFFDLNADSFKELIDERRRLGESIEKDPFESNDDYFARVISLKNNIDDYEYSLVFKINNPSNNLSGFVYYDVNDKNIKFNFDNKINHQGEIFEIGGSSEIDKDFILFHVTDFRYGDLVPLNGFSSLNGFVMSGFAYGIGFEEKHKKIFNSFEVEKNLAKDILKNGSLMVNFSVKPIVFKDSDPFVLSHFYGREVFREQDLIILKNFKGIIGNIKKVSIIDGAGKVVSEK